MSVTVVVADDQSLVRSSLRLLLDAEPDITVVGEAGDGAAAVREAIARRPDVVVMDVRMPVMDGIEATGRIVAAGAGTVLVLTTFDSDDHLMGALRAGAAGFVLKDDDAATLVGAVRAVARGDGFVSPRPTMRLIRATAGSRPRVVPPELERLTPRERDVLLLLGDGLSNQQIAHRLRVEGSTVKSHVQRVLTKLGLTSRVQAAILAHDAGLLREHR